MSKGYISNALAVTAAISVAVIASYQKELGQINYKNNCKAEYIETTVTNKQLYKLPNSINTVNDCKFKVTYSQTARHQYYALDPQERTSFSIKGRVRGDYVSVVEVFKNDVKDMKQIVVSLSKSKLHSTGSRPECFVDNAQEYCFISERDIYKPLQYRDKTKTYQITVDTVGTIHNIQSYGRL